LGVLFVIVARFAVKEAVKRSEKDSVLPKETSFQLGKAYP